MSDTDREVVRLMQTSGGSFIKALAEAALSADPINLERIKLTWDAEWDRYAYAVGEIKKKAKAAA